MACEAHKLRCTRRCVEECVPCKSPVMKKRQACEHTIRVQCNLDPDEVDCTEKCGGRLPCGHNCPKKCHAPDIEGVHAEATTECAEVCGREVCSQHKTVCKKKCKDECSSCKMTVEKTLKCGHTHKVPCCAQDKDVECTTICSRILPCGHPCTMACFEKCDVTICQHPVKKELRCGHEVEVGCQE